MRCPCCNTGFQPVRVHENVRIWFALRVFIFVCENMQIGQRGGASPLVCVRDDGGGRGGVLAFKQTNTPFVVACWRWHPFGVGAKCVLGLCS